MGFEDADVVFVLISNPRKHVVFGSSEETPDEAHPTNVADFIQRYSRRTGDIRDTYHRSRKRVVQGQWVHECAKAERTQFYSDGWEILSVFRICPNFSWLIYRVNEKVDDVEAAEDDREAQEEDAPSSVEEYGYAASTSRIIPQVPSLAIPKVPRPSCQIRQTSTLEETLCRVMRVSFGSGQWRPVNPTQSMLSKTPASSSEVSYVGNPDGVFAKGQFLPLTFHVLGGTMQRLAEADISVCRICFVLIGTDLQNIGGGSIVPLHRASIVVVPEFSHNRRQSLISHASRTTLRRSELIADRYQTESGRRHQASIWHGPSPSHDFSCLTWIFSNGSRVNDRRQSHHQSWTES